MDRVSAEQLRQALIHAMTMYEEACQQLKDLNGLYKSKLPVWMKMSRMLKVDH
jgi:hypothetical protein